MEFQQRLTIEQGLNGSRAFRSGLSDHFGFVIFRKVFNHDIEHETIQLGFGQRICSFHLDGILCGKNKEGFVQRIASSGSCDLVFLHGLEQGGLGFGRRSIDFIGQQDICKNRSGNEPHGSSTIFVFLQYFRARDVGGHEVGSKLDAIETEVEQLSDGFHQQCFGKTWRSRQQAVAA